MSGLTNKTLAMGDRLPFEEALERRHADAVPEQDSSFGAVERLALGVARHLQEDVAEPVVRGITEPPLPDVRVIDVDERLGEALAEERAQLRVVLGPRVGRARR